MVVVVAEIDGRTGMEQPGEQGLGADLLGAMEGGRGGVDEQGVEVAARTARRRHRRARKPGSWNKLSLRGIRDADRFEARQRIQYLLSRAPPTNSALVRKPFVGYKGRGKLSAGTRHRTLKYLNDVIEPDHGALKRVIRPTLAFQTLKKAAATIKGSEVMRYDPTRALPNCGLRQRSFMQQSQLAS